MAPGIINSSHNDNGGIKMNKLFKKITAAVCAGTLLLSMAACGQSQSGSNNLSDTKDTSNALAQNTVSEANTGENTDENTEFKEINVVLDWYPNAIHAFIYDAIEKGYYEEEGLKVNIQFPSNENDAISLVAAGKAEIGTYYMQDVITTRTNQNVPVKSIASIAQKPLNIILSLKDKNITSPKDLEGKTIGYAGTDLSMALVKFLLENAGIEYDESKLINVGFDLMASMTTGQVDATIGCLVNHEVPQMEEEGFEVNYFNLDDYGVPTYYELVFLANDEMIQNDSETLKAFLRASKKGFEDMKNDPAAVLQILLDNQNAENFPLSETVETKSMEILLPIMEMDDSAFLSQSDEIWQENIDWLYDQGLVNEKKDVSEFMTTELMPE